MKNNSRREPSNMAGIPCFEEYQQMDEEGKNRELQRSLIRLQNRIYKIVHLMNEELKNRHDTAENGRSEQG